MLKQIQIQPYLGVKISILNQPTTPLQPINQLKIQIQIIHKHSYKYSILNQQPINQPIALESSRKA